MTTENNRKTIRMKRETATKWLAALRSGEYEQATEVLYDGQGGYCCLGVLQHCLTGKTQVNDDGSEVPSMSWLTEHGVEFIGITGERFNSPYILSEREWVTGLNDGGVPFKEISDIIEKNLEYTD